MLLIQLTGLSGAGKTSIANLTSALLSAHTPAVDVVVIDADVYRQTVNKDLGFSRKDRLENIRRLGEIAHDMLQQHQVAIIAAINPYAKARIGLEEKYHARTVWIDCDTETLIQRDTKGLYKRALFTPKHPEKITNLSGINDPYELPENPALIIQTANEDLPTSADTLANYILHELSLQPQFLNEMIQR